MASEHHDVLIVGAGLSGIGAAVHLHRSCPGKRYVILEGRAGDGRHLGSVPLSRRPLRQRHAHARLPLQAVAEAKAIADGPSILNYVQEAAAEYGVDDHIRYRHLATTRASWSSEDAAWTVEAVRQDTGETVRFTCNFLLMCAGYYSYRQGYTPEFEGIERFTGHRSSIPSSGPRTSTTGASGWSSSAPARRR